MVTYNTAAQIQPILCWFRVQYVDLGYNTVVRCRI